MSVRRVWTPVFGYHDVDKPVTLESKPNTSTLIHDVDKPISWNVKANTSHSAT